MNYWDDPEHSRWQFHYDDWPNHSPKLLAFTPEFQQTNLPEDGSNGFTCELLDKTTGLVYRYPIYVAYDCDSKIWIPDEDYEPAEKVVTLHEYFYSDHTCQCHRHTAACFAGLAESDVDFECGGDRFWIQAVTYDKLPGVILYSETMTSEELEVRLLATKVH